MSKFILCALIALSSTTLWAAPQVCPTESTDVPISITGALEYHPGVYDWYGLRTTVPVCGQEVISVGLGSSVAFRETHRFAQCKVTVTGKLIVPVTGYWSTALAITEAHIQPAKNCKQGKPLPDYSAIPIPSGVRAYEVTASYDPSTYLFFARVHDALSGRLLSPWQSYISDSGNGARDLQRMFCAEGFTASQPKSITHLQIEPTVDSDMPRAIDVELEDNSHTLEVSFTCNRSHSAKTDRFR